MKTTLLTLAVIAIAALPLKAHSAAKSATTDTVVTHHLRASAAADLEGVMSDYAANAIVIAPQGVLRGASEIRAFFTEFFRANAATAAGLKLQRKVTQGEVGYISYVLNEGTKDQLFGSDTYIVHRGKIAVETVVSAPMAPFVK